MELLITIILKEQMILTETWLHTWLEFCLERWRNLLRLMHLLLVHEQMSVRLMLLLSRGIVQLWSVYENLRAGLIFIRFHHVYLTHSVRLNF